MHVDAIVTGRFHTGNPDHPEAHTLAIHHGRIVAVDDVDGLTPRARHDFGDKRIVPGFHDAHHHHAFTGQRLAMVDLRYPAVTNLDEAYAAIAERAASLPAGAWVKGTGYDQNRLGGHPTAEGLDAVTGGRPAIIEHVSGHMVVANTAALELAGAPGREGFDDIPGGRVIRDADGRAEGLLQETAANPIRLLAGDISEAEIEETLRLASEQSISYGLTSVTEPGILAGGTMGTNSPVIASYQAAIEKGLVKPRLTVMPFHQVLHELEHGAEGWKTLDMGIRTGLGDDRLRFGPVKIISDGSLIGRSAAVHDCYCGEPDNYGVMQLSPEELHEAILAYHRAGWTVATHAIGDRAIDAVLDAVAEAQRQFPREARHRIEHFAIATDVQVARCAELGVIPVPQGVFISEFGDGILDALGPERTAGTYRMRSLLDAGMVVPGSTDSPVSDANPLKSIHDLVNRRTASGAEFAPAERVTIAEAVAAYTYGSAYAVGRETEVGTLAPGMLADFAVLDRDVFTISSEEIEQTEVVATVIGGEVVYGDPHTA